MPGKTEPKLKDATLQKLCEIITYTATGLTGRDAKRGVPAFPIPSASSTSVLPSESSPAFSREFLRDALRRLERRMKVVVFDQLSAAVYCARAEDPQGVMQQDALDILTTISLIHRRLDSAVRTHVR